MGQALYRSYRSRKFSEVVGQDHITSTLATALKNGRISHAYLFTGPRGVGKTSVARILAHEVNNITYEGEDFNLDIIEIDAASNRRIDEIRDLRDKINITPSSSKYKVYIIDEVHMLTKEAFNALLKTLEEPPAHVIFILATTEAHKLPDTIISRTQRYHFRAITEPDAIKHLAFVAKTEKIKIDNAALEIIAKFGDGSFRDSLSLLDQLNSVSSKITADIVREHLGLPEKETVFQIMDYISQGNTKALLNELDSLGGRVDAATLAKSLASEMRSQIVTEDTNSLNIELLKSLIEVPASLNPAENLEVALIEASLINSTSKIELNTSKINKVISKDTTTEKYNRAVEMTSIKKSTDFDLQMWEEVLDGVKAKAASVYTALRLAAPVLEKNELKLYFEFPLHQKKINQAQHKAIISDVIEDVCGDNIVVRTYLDKELVRSKAANKDELQPLNFSEVSELNAISNIFGSAEVLES